MDIYTYLYDSKGNDKEINLDDFRCSDLAQNQLLWVNILRRDAELIKYVTAKLEINDAPIQSLLETDERPQLDKFESFYHFFVSSVQRTETGLIIRVPIDYVVGENYVLTIHEGDVDYFIEFRDREKGETQIGDLDAESFLVTLLDLHLVTYFRTLEKIEDTVDKLDVEILKKDLQDEDFLKETVRLKSDVAKLRRWLLPHRDVFYALARPDFLPIAQSDSLADFQRLSQHFENAVDAVESSRDTVLSLFDLYTTRAAHRMNSFIKTLTFVTFMVGMLGAAAGIFGMNFKLDFFDNPNGFWQALLGMGILAALLAVIGKIMRWI